MLPSREILVSNVAASTEGLALAFSHAGLCTCTASMIGSTCIRTRKRSGPCCDCGKYIFVICERLLRATTTRHLDAAHFMPMRLEVARTGITRWHECGARSRSVPPACALRTVGTEAACAEVAIWLGGWRQLNCLLVPCRYFSAAVSLPLCYACTMLSGKVQASLEGLRGTMLCTCI